MSDELALHPSTGMTADVFADKEAFNQLVRVADAFSKTALVPEAYRGKPADCMVAIDMANRMGLPPADGDAKPVCCQGETVVERPGMYVHDPRQSAV